MFNHGGDDQHFTVVILTTRVYKNNTFLSQFCTSSSSCRPEKFLDFPDSVLILNSFIHHLSFLPSLQTVTYFFISNCLLLGLPHHPPPFKYQRAPSLVFEFAQLIIKNYYLCSKKVEEFSSRCNLYFLHYPVDFKYFTWVFDNQIKLKA